MDSLYQDLVYKFALSNIKFEKMDNGFYIKYDSSIDNYVAKLLQDFYYFVGYNVLLLNQNGNCKVCIELQDDDYDALIKAIKNSFDSYNEEVDYTIVMDKDVKNVFEIFKRSLKYPGNFGIGVKSVG